MFDEKIKQYIIIDDLDFLRIVNYSSFQFFFFFFLFFYFRSELFFCVFMRYFIFNKNNNTKKNAES